MNFAVDPDDLKDFARGLDTLAAAATQAQTYSSWTNPKADGGALLQRWVGLVQPVHPAVSEMFAHLHKISDASADELVATARDYEMTDTKAAARADAKLAKVEGADDGALDRTGQGQGPSGGTRNVPLGGVGPFGADHE